MDIETMEEFLGFDDMVITKVEEKKDTIDVYLHKISEAEPCPNCGQMTKYVHDYRTQRIEHIPYEGKPVDLVVRKKRLVCKKCNKRFDETLSFVDRYQRKTNLL